MYFFRSFQLPRDHNSLGFESQAM